MLRLRIQPPWLPRLINRIIVQHIIWGCFFCFDTLAFLLFRNLHLHGWILLTLPLTAVQLITAGRIYRQVRKNQQFPYLLYGSTAVATILGLIILFLIWKFSTRYGLVGWMHVLAALICMANGWLEWKALQHNELVITAEGIQFPDQWRRLFIPWRKISHAVIKNDVFTLQLVDNRWWQWEISPEQEATVAEVIRFLQEQRS